MAALHDSLAFMAEALRTVDPIPNENVCCAACGESGGDCMCFCRDCEGPLVGDECAVCVPRCGGCGTRLCEEGRRFWDPGSRDERDWDKVNGELCESCIEGDDIIARSAQITEQIRRAM